MPEKTFHQINSRQMLKFAATIVLAKFVKDGVLQDPPLEIESKA